ncbi:WD40 domain containing protein [Pyrrhoderma noxium]|uniref:WD40 domain containing protein n=1 Tax=Pyrrhoderma noxium TaxID=2282107 RepID=A0A286UTT5_9AGAM|nr:WD40 domain containing protein [Pyrrhoderma noxium]
MVAPKVFQVGPGLIGRVSFSPDGGRFVSKSSDDIRIWDASWRMEETKTTPEEREKISSISLSPGGKFIASGSLDGSIYLWNVLTGELGKKLKLRSSVASVAFSPANERHIAFGSNDKKVDVWDVTDNKTVTIGNHTDWVTSVVFSPDGKHVASCSGDDLIRIWNVNRRKLSVSPLAGHEDSVNAVAYSPDGKRLVSGSRDKTVRIWKSV